MNPVQLPKRIRRQMQRRALFPIVVDLIAHVLDFFWNHVRAWRLVPASADLDPSRPKVSGI